MVVDCLLPMAKTRLKPDLLQGTLDLLILRTLQWGPQHGHGIGVALRASSDEVLNVDHGSLYPALHRLERQGWVDAEWKLSGNKQRAKYYRITAAGRRQLAVERTRWSRLSAAVAKVLGPA
jgi:PadR family transcriptional regulator PadR